MCIGERIEQRTTSDVTSRDVPPRQPYVAHFLLSHLGRGATPSTDPTCQSPHEADSSTATDSQTEPMSRRRQPSVVAYASQTLCLGMNFDLTTNTRSLGKKDFSCFELLSIKLHIAISLKTSYTDRMTTDRISPNILRKSHSNHHYVPNSF